MANSVDPDQTAPIGSTLFASILNMSVMLGNYLQQTTSADDIFRCIFFLGALRVKIVTKVINQKHLTRRGLTRIFINILQTRTLITRRCSEEQGHDGKPQQRIMG